VISGYSQQKSFHNGFNIWESTLMNIENYDYPTIHKKLEQDE